MRQENKNTIENSGTIAPLFWTFIDLIIMVGMTGFEPKRPIYKRLYIGRLLVLVCHFVWLLALAMLSRRFNPVLVIWI